MSYMKINRDGGLYRYLTESAICSDSFMPRNLCALCRRVLFTFLAQVLGYSVAVLFGSSMLIAPVVPFMVWGLIEGTIFEVFWFLGVIGWGIAVFVIGAIGLAVLSDWCVRCRYEHRKKIMSGQRPPSTWDRVLVVMGMIHGKICPTVNYEKKEQAA